MFVSSKIDLFFDSDISSFLTSLLDDIKVSKLLKTLFISRAKGLSLLTFGVRVRSVLEESRFLSKDPIGSSPNG